MGTSRILAGPPRHVIPAPQFVILAKAGIQRGGEEGARSPGREARQTPTGRPPMCSFPRPKIRHSGPSIRHPGPPIRHSRERGNPEGWGGGDPYRWGLSPGLGCAGRPLESKLDPMTKLTTAVEHYLTDLRRVRASGGATGERSIYGPLANLLNDVGATLKPKVFCVGELADQGAGHPDFGLYSAKQVQRGRPREGQTPERGVVEVKSAGDDAWLTAAGHQVSRYWDRYRLVLVTNTRDFVLLGTDPSGRPIRLETFRLADSAEDFDRLLEKPRAFARRAGAGLGEYLCRALSHSATLAEPKDLAWLLASYARDGLARVEAAGDSPALAAVRSALEDALGVRFEGERGAAFFRSTLVQTLFYGVFSAWVLWARQVEDAPVRAPPPAGSFNWHEAVWHLRAPVLRACSSSYPTPAGCGPLASSRSSTGPPPPSTGSTRRRSSPASTRACPPPDPAARRCPTSTSRFSKPSIPGSASSSASGTRQTRSCATWSPASTGPSRTISASPTA